MLRLMLIFASVVLILGGYAARWVENAVSPAPNVAAVQPVQPVDGPRQPVSSTRSLTVEADRRGHFKIEGRVDGRRLDFMVDTGASLVALRASDAAQVGIRPMRSDFTVTVNTANGNIMAARASLPRVEIGHITVFDVAALVLPDEALSQNLLGVSFLSRLRRYEYANGRLVMEQ